MQAAFGSARIPDASMLVSGLPGMAEMQMECPGCTDPQVQGLKDDREPQVKGRAGWAIRPAAPGRRKSVPG